MEGLSPGEARYVRKLATLLRVADALDRSHAQPIGNMRAEISGAKVTLRLLTQGPADLELWDVGHEAQLFHKVFSATLAVTTAATKQGKGADRQNRRRIVT
jgi:exopolyphosphatase/guanosine-5'-triphosphate,3'-diphosphate pyrophosphatase